MLIEIKLFNTYFWA